MINQLSLSQLEHKARIENNDLALIILEKMEEELEESVDEALQSLPQTARLNTGQKYSTTTAR